MSIKLVLVAACALVDADGRVLLTERPAGKSMAGLWEFPGGKIETGERPEETLIRELKEELGIVVREPCLAPLTFASQVMYSRATFRNVGPTDRGSATVATCSATISRARSCAAATRSNWPMLRRTRYALRRPTRPA